MFDPEKTARSLTGEQKRRLQAIAQAQKALPWEDVDEGLCASKLVGLMTGPLDEPLAEISQKGWDVLSIIARQR